MGWIILLFTAGLVLALLWKLGKFDVQALQFVGIMLLASAAGYGVQGHPNQAGSPTEAVEDKGAEEVPEDLRRSFRSSMNQEGQWLMLADALMRAGKPRTAVSILGEGARRAPQNADIWVGLGQALFVHGGNQMNPAAQYAFEKAEKLAPELPGPAFFKGLGLAQAGRYDDATAVWNALLARAPKDAAWRADLEQRLAVLKQVN